MVKLNHGFHRFREKPSGSKDFKPMHIRSAGMSSVLLVSWSLRFVEGLREEYHAARILGQDRAFLATRKGRNYEPPDETYYDDHDSFMRH
jgi:hypothetical protein